MDSVRTKQFLQQLEQDGYTDVQPVTLPFVENPEPHTHDIETVHVILEGELEIVDVDGSVNVYRVGDKVVFPAGTTHVPKPGKDGCTMLVGFKE